MYEKVQCHNFFITKVLIYSMLRQKTKNLYYLDLIVFIDSLLSYWL